MAALVSVPQQFLPLIFLQIFQQRRLFLAVPALWNPLLLPVRFSLLFSLVQTSFHLLISAAVYYLPVQLPFFPVGFLPFLAVPVLLLLVTESPAFCSDYPTCPPAQYHMAFLHQLLSQP